MKIIISESQSKKLINNIIKEQNVLSKLSNVLNIVGANNKSNDDFNSPTDGTPEFAENIPKDDSLMHPLGQKFRITSLFGRRNSTVGSKNHQGIDIAAPSGSKVYAPKDGIIEVARDTSPNGCGGFIKIKHDNLITKFCHLKQWVVKPGDMVKKGQLIGYSGGGPDDPYRGTSSGPHLHYEIRSLGDVAQNPLSVQTNLA